MRSIGLFISLAVVPLFISSISYAQDEYFSAYDVSSTNNDSSFSSQDFDSRPVYNIGFTENHKIGKKTQNTENDNLVYASNRSDDEGDDYSYHSHKKKSSGYASRLPHHLSGYNEKVILINPRVHAWGAYDEQGDLIRAGLATAGSRWCPDIGRACRTKSGSFRIHSLGSSSCVSSKYPVGKGGAPMPYCMFFNGMQGLHGSHEVVEGNISHGCVRLHVDDAEWIRFNFATIGTKVIVTSY